MLSNDFHAYFMRMALREAEKAAEAGEVPTGCVIIRKPEDPLLQVTVPGAYGVEGGDVVYSRTQAQISRLTDGDTYSFSLLYPADVKVVSISVPSSLEAGADVSVGYRVVEKDRTLVKTDYTARVLRIREPYVWLKASDSVYFVIRK